MSKVTYTQADEIIIDVRVEKLAKSVIVRNLNAMCAQKAELANSIYWKMEDDSVVIESQDGIFDTTILSRFPVLN